MTFNIDNLAVKGSPPMPEYSMLSIDNFQLNLHIGVTEEEREERQKVYVTIMIENKLDVDPGFYSDNINDVTDYESLLLKVKTLEERHFCLIERATQELLRICQPFVRRGSKIQVKVHKYPSIDGLISGVVYTVYAAV